MVEISACMERVRDKKKKKRVREKLGKMAQEADQRFLGDPKEELIPGIPNEIATDLIAAKLPWRDMYKLSLVSTNWARAIRGRKVYDARVRSGSTETLLLVTHSPNMLLHPCSFTRTMALVYTTDKSSCNLPRIPYIKGRVLLGSQRISVNGNLYHLGGYDPDNDMTSDKVYVLDLVGQKQWRESASMLHRRCWFGCGAIDGKIYVFGGAEHDFYDTSEAKGTAEVYDPTSNTWSLVKDMPCSRTMDKVAQVGEDLLVYGGWEIGCEDDSIRQDFAYHPIKDQWRVVEPVDHTVFKTQGKLYAMHGYDIHVYDAERKSWPSLHEVSYFGIPCKRTDLFHVINAVAIDDRLLALVHWVSRTGNKLGIFEGNGLGWQKKQHIKMLRVKVWSCNCNCNCAPLLCDPGTMITVSI